MDEQNRHIARGQELMHLINLAHAQEIVVAAIEKTYYAYSAQYRSPEEMAPSEYVEMRDIYRQIGELLDGEHATGPPVLGEDSGDPGR